MRQLQACDHQSLSLCSKSWECNETRVRMRQKEQACVKGCTAIVFGSTGSSMQPGSAKPRVVTGSTHSFSLMNFLGPVPSPSEALTCHSVWDAGDHHPLRLRLDARIWILHLHHKRFDLQSTTGMGGVTGADRREPRTTAALGSILEGPQEWTQ